MITVRFERKDDILSMSLKGHAGAAVKGHDIICAAASILCYTAAQVMQFMFEEQELSEKPDIFLEEGNSHVIAKPKEEHYNECVHAFFVVQAGYALLARSYPKYIELISFGKSEEDFSK